MNTSPNSPSVMSSPVESLPLSEAASRRFPFATAYLGFQLLLLGLLILPALVLNMVPGASVRQIMLLVVYVPVSFIAFRWAINKHILPYVAAATTGVTDYAGRFSLQNPFLIGVLAYWAMTRLTTAVSSPVVESIKPQLGAVGVALDFLIEVIVCYPPFAIAVKYVVLKPYKLKRLLPMLGLIVVLTFSVSFAISLAELRQEWAFYNRIYCEVLKPGMTEAEVTTALGEFGAQGQFNSEHGVWQPPAEHVATSTTPYFDDYKLQYHLRLVFGYNSEGTLLLVGRYDDGSRGVVYTPVTCPLPFQ